MMRVRVYGVPKPQGRPRAFRMGTFVRIYSPKTDWFSLVHVAALRVRPKVPLNSALYLSVRFIFPRPKAARSERWKATKPDADNCLKAVMDALTNAGWWRDDGRVSLVTMQKVYESPGDEPGADIEVVELQEMAKEGAPAIRARGARTRS